MTAADIIVLGSINADLVVKSRSLPRPGETVIDGEFFRAAGGKGANQAVAAARCSSTPVYFVAARGDDDFGREISRLLRDENIDCRSLKVVSDVATGIALILVDAAGENLISVASGANASLSPDDVAAVDESVFRAARVFLASLETGVKSVVAGLRRAKQAGLYTILNPAPACKDLLDSEILGHVDLLTPNESEFELLTGMVPSSSVRAVESAQRLRGLGCSAVVLTRGDEGALILEADGVSEVPVHRVHAVDTTGAGDAFNGALAVALAEGCQLSAACEFAGRAAAISVTRLGAQPSFPTRREIDGGPQYC